MQVYKTPLKEFKFLFNDFLNLNGDIILKSKNLEIEDLNLILEEASKLCEETLLPLNQSGDLEGSRFENGNVYTPKGFKEAYDIFSSNGWQGIKVSEEYGGQDLPYIMNMLLDEMISSTNMSFGLFPGLTSNAIDAIEKNASEELKNLYLPHLTSGKWSGTMNLTEPQCGTDLGLSKTIAIPNEDNSFNITGTKIFITCGEHNLTENIIHLVLARTPNAPEGIKGISLFLVPKFLPNDDGSIGKKNSLSCGSIEKKMGIKASPTCVMNYDNAKGWLVGDLNKGMKAMFVMMNGARLFVGVQGLGLSEIAYQSALYYSKDRFQGKSPNSNNKSDLILVHPEIRKNLLYIKAVNEGIRGLMLYTGYKYDVSKLSKDNKEITQADNFVSLMTPILKSYATDIAIKTTYKALQIYGGHGYINDHGMEQLERDARITTLYEGTNGIQALDLIGRKMNIENGKLIDDFIKEIDNYLNNINNSKMKEFIEIYTNAYDDFKDVYKHIKSIDNNVNEINSHAVEFLKLLSLISVGYIWLKFIDISLDKKEEDFYKSKIETGYFFLNKILPESLVLKKIIFSGGDVYNNYKDNYFETSYN